MSPSENQEPGRRSGWKGLVEIAKEALARSAEHQARDMGASITYWVFFSIFPMVIGMIAIAGFFLDSARVQDQILQMVNDALPGSGDLVEKQLDAVVGSRGTFGILGVVGLLWSGSAGLGAISRAMNRAWGTLGRHPTWWNRIRSFLMMFVVAGLLLSSTLLMAAFEFLHRKGFEPLMKLGLDSGMAARIQGLAFSFACVFVVFLMIYKVTPNVSITLRQALPGAIVAAILFEVAKNGFIFYLERFADYSVYGSLASIIVLLLWIYVVARLTILCCELNVVLDERRRGG